MDKIQTEIAELKQTIRSLRQTLGDLRLEVRTLRQYGNKDCTAMAEEAMARVKGGQNPNQQELPIDKNFQSTSEYAFSRLLRYLS